MFSVMKLQGYLNTKSFWWLFNNFSETVLIKHARSDKYMRRTFGLPPRQHGHS